MEMTIFVEKIIQNLKILIEVQYTLVYVQYTLHQLIIYSNMFGQWKDTRHSSLRRVVIFYNYFGK